MNKENYYNPVIDILRIISIFAVVFIHTTTRTLEASLFDLSHYPFSIFLNQIFRFAVPLFFMISGFVLELNFHLHESYLAYLKKRISRILIPYIFWSSIYFFVIYTRHSENFFQALLGGDASYQLYFIPALLLFYIIFPIIHKYYSFFSNKFVFIFLGTVQILLLYINYYLHPLSTFYPVSIALLNYFIFFLGVVCSKHIKEITQVFKKWRYIFYAITLILALYVFLEGESLYFKTHNYLYFYSQWRPSVFIYTVFLSAFLYYIFSKNFLPIALIKTLSRLSFFVFFIHIIILELVWSLFGKNIFLQSQNVFGKLWFDPFYFITVIIISFLIAFIAHKIPKLNKLTG